MTTPVARAARHSATHMAVAFLAMGGWAVFANRAHPLPQALAAGAVQGTLSACITFGLKRTVEALAARLPGLGALVLPPLTAAGVSAALLGAIHTAAGTPEVLATVALPWTVATSYAALYSWTLWRRPHG